MPLLIADTFTTSLAKLTGDEQKAVKTTAFDLQLNPESPGLQFHKLLRAKDPNFWSVRVNLDIRLIVPKTGLLPRQFLKSRPNNLSYTRGSPILALTMIQVRRFSAPAGVFLFLLATVLRIPPSLALSALVDPTFDIGPPPNGDVAAIALQAPDKIIVAGDFGRFGDAEHFRIVRLNNTGSVDSTFATVVAGSINAVAVDAGNRVLIGGHVSLVNGQARNGLARLTPDGALDATFAITTLSAGGMVTDIVVAPDQKILIGGYFTTINGATRSMVARLNADGSIDNSFNPPFVDGTVTKLARDASGRVIVSGHFTTVGGRAQRALARLTDTGVVDAGFAPILGDSISSFGLQADGSVVALRSFPTNVNGENTAPLARFLGTDGSRDPAFSSTAGVSGGSQPTIMAVAVQPDGRLLLGGNFTRVNGTASAGLARLNADGTLDQSFPIGTGVTGGAAQVTALALEIANGRALVGGAFAAVDGEPRNRVARIITAPTVGSIDDQGLAIATDRTNNIYLVGDTSGRLGQVSAGGRDAWIAKYNAAGAQQWIVQFGTPLDDIAYGIAVDVTGSLFVAGSSAIGSPNSGGFYGHKGWLAKYSAAGVQQWSADLDTPGDDQAFAVATDRGGNVFIAGRTSGTFVLPEPLAGYRGWVAKYSRTGTQAWIRQYSPPGQTAALTLAVDTSGAVFVGGHTTGGGPTHNDLWLAKYDRVGNVIWNHVWGSSEHDYLYSAATDAMSSVYAGGFTLGSLSPNSPNAGGYDGWLGKRSASGSLTWLRQFGSTPRNDDRTHGVAVDAKGFVYATGQTAGSLGAYNPSFTDMWLAKHDSNGALLWRRQLGVPGVEVSAQAIAIDRVGMVVVIGGTNGQFGDTRGTGTDVWVAKFLNNGTLVWKKQLGR